MGAQILTGLVLAFVIGYAMKLFNRCDAKNTKWPKFFTVVVFAIIAPIASDLSGFPESKFIFIIFYGYMCFRQWGDDKPEHELAVFWMFCQPMLFGTVGAAVLFDKIEGSQIGKGLIVIFIGVTARWLATFIVTCEKKFTYKERMFMAFAWIPKATVQAALGGMTLSEAQRRGLPEYEEYGQAMLTTAVFAICITAPLGAIMINTLGSKWLDYDGDDPELLAKHGMTEPREGFKPKHTLKKLAEGDLEEDKKELVSEDVPVPDTRSDLLNGQKTNAVVPDDQEIELVKQIE